MRGYVRLTSIIYAHMYPIQQSKNTVLKPFCSPDAVDRRGKLFEPNAESLLDHRLRRWPNSEAALSQRLIFTRKAFRELLFFSECINLSFISNNSHVHSYYRLLLRWKHFTQPRNELIRQENINLRRRSQEVKPLCASKLGEPI